MKRLPHKTSALLHALIILAVLILFSSCTDNNRRISATLAQADSLLNTDPERSLEIVLSVDTLGHISRRNETYRDYLRTTARYKAFYPVAEDTSIFSATEFFRRRGPQGIYGKSLMIQGAVLYEQDRVEEALESYKQAETALEGVGSYNDLGLINTRIGELYQQSYVNDREQISRYRKALEYFELSGDRRRIAMASLEYAKSLMKDSLSVAQIYTEKGISIAEEIDDTASLVLGYETLFYLEVFQDNDTNIIRLGKFMLDKFGNYLQEYDLKGLNNVYLHLAHSQLNTGQIKEAVSTSANIKLSSIGDKASYFFLLDELAQHNGDWKSAYKYGMNSYKICDSLYAANYDRNLTEIERKYDILRIKDEYLQSRIKNLIITISLLVALIVSLTVIFIIRIRLKEKEHQSQEYLSQFNIMKTEMTEYSEKMKRQIHSNESTQKLVGELMDVIEEIGYNYDIYSRRPNDLANKVKKTIDETLSQMNFANKARDIVENQYPGMLAELFSEYPKLKEEDRWIITLMCCHFSTSTICVMTRLSDVQLRNRKAELRKKLNAEERISIFLKNRMKKHSFITY